MFFQIDVTPKAKKHVEPIKKTEKKHRYSLLLAPFQSQTRIELETTINTTTETYLDIKNTSVRPLCVTVTKKPPDERNISLSSTEITIESNDKKEICIKWQPLEHGSWRDVLQFMDNRRIKYDVVVVCTTIGSISDDSKSKVKKGLRNRAPLSKTSKTLISNDKNLVHINTQLKRSIDNETLIPNKDMCTKKLKLSNDCVTVCDKENISNYNEFPESSASSIRDKKLLSDQNPDFSKLNKPELQIPTFRPVPELRRETYVKEPRFSISNTSDIICRDDLSFEKCDEEKFDDSLSPPKCEPNRYKSDFSMILDNFALTSVNVHEKMSQATSLESACIAPKSKNETFDISSQKSHENSYCSPANGTYELPKSPSDSNDFMKQMTSQNSEFLSSMTPMRDDYLEMSRIRNLTASSPIPTETATGTWDTSKRYSTGASLTAFSDSASAKEVLEADLWIKPKNYYESNIQSGNFRLETITESTSIIVEETSDKMNTTHTVIATDEKLSTVCIQISPPKKLRSSRSMPIHKISPRKNSKVSKDKYAHETGTLKKKVHLNTSLKKSGNVSIPGVRITKLSLAGLKKPKNETKIKQPKEVSVKLHDPNDLIMQLCNPDPFAASTVQDPFLTSTLYYDEHWMYEQEIVFKRWLNTLLSPPEQLNADIETACVDVGKVWQSCRMKEETVLAETKEAVSARYHTNIRLNTLRKAACAMFRKQEVVHVLSRTAVCIEKGVLNVRSDRNLHKDVGLQKGILELFLSYNPLWLRIGLETIYGETIPLHSNDDWIGLTRFLLNRFFADPFLMKQYAHPYLRNQSAFITQINKFMLKKFLLLVYFLDYAKCNKLIGHDPCLFYKRAMHKESRSILLTFSREVLSGIGDITKVLRAYDYVVTHKQTYLDEYDYAVTNICTDLRDGVRLCRVMELITGKRDLTRQCRVPAISRLQKVHNVDIALKALLQCDCTLAGNIEAKNIADGHREKTLSLLWQIIYKYQAPRFDKAAKTVQRWWRAMLWYVHVKRFLQNRQRNAACTIQRTWRCWLAKQQLNRLRENHRQLLIQRESAAQVIQISWRRYKLKMYERNHFLRTKLATIRLQRWWRRIRATRGDVGVFRSKRNASMAIQRWWRAEISMRKERQSYIILRNTTIRIQRHWRMRTIRNRYLYLKKAVVFVQTRWRANVLMRGEREHYQQLLGRICIIQNWWRSIQKMKKIRSDYLMTKDAAMTIERWWLCVLERKRYIRTQRAIVFLQRAWRSRQTSRNRLMQSQRRQDACLKIQSWWRMIILVRRYRLLKTSCIVIQRQWRSILFARTCRMNFIATRNAAITIHRYWKTRKTRQRYLKLKMSTLKIQTFYRGLLMTRAQLEHYAKVRKAIVHIQRWWRSIRLLRKERHDYLQLRSTVLMLQIRRRTLMTSRRTRYNYLVTRKACISIQSWWRMIKTKKEYHNLLEKRRTSAITLQRLWRAKIVGRNMRMGYHRLRSQAIVIQRWWRNMTIAREERKKYLEKRSAAIILQTYWRSFVIGRNEKRKFCALKTATITVQRRFRANRIARVTKLWYTQFKKTVINVQRRYRAKKVGQLVRSNFVSYRQAAIIIQSYWRMKVERKKYLFIKTATTKIQSHYRAYILGRKIRTNYILLRQTTINLQRRYRANKACIKCKANYTTLRRTVIWVQKKWRNTQYSRLCREEFSRQRLSAIKIQRWWRCSKFLKNNPYIRSRISCSVNCNLSMSMLQSMHSKYLRAATTIQRWWRRILQERKERIRITHSVQVIEHWWLKVLQMRKKHHAATRIQALWKAHKIRKSQCARMTELRKRCEEATKNAISSATLASRYEDAINKFTCCENIGQLSMSLMALDTITRLSPCACITLCELNLVDSVYETLAQSNRSLPWMTVNTRAASILLTLAKFSPTQTYVRKSKYAIVIAKLLSASTEYKELFLNLATLLWILGEDENYVMEISSCHQTNWLLTSLYNKIMKKKTKPVINTGKLKEQDNMLPSKKPDWGLRQKQPRVFTDVQYAIVTIMKQFNL